ncbi:MAG: NADH-quinone oxidoreductase subunit NuoK, partial [Candidatus Poribacteria bacterium]|nr:NADH-quinone oxidoreductase subunit NuoK [Candidatus Poribacteria bacterium]
MTLEHYLLISSILFTLGVFAVLTRRNAITILMGIELILNSCNINFIAFSRFIKPPTTVVAGEVSLAIEGQIMALFVIVLAAAEAAVFLAII